MSRDASPGSFDSRAPRSAPASISGTTAAGEPVTVVFVRPTLVVAVKADCDGCRDFLAGAGADVEGVDQVVVASDASAIGDSTLLAIVSPEAMRLLGLSWPPTYVLVDPRGPTVVAEGAVFSAAQVASEVAPFRGV
ncbi:MAG: hypothetical protein ACRDV0_10300 [Acidimicrobiales bacterium]